MKKVSILVLAVFLGIITSCSDAASSYDEVRYFTMDGDKLQRPTDYRKWVYVGTPTTPNDMNNGKAAFPEFHNVYIDPTSYKHWKATGEWREGTILIKELVSVGTKAAVSGNGYFMGDFIGLEATIKSKKLFPNEPGNWSYFSFTNPGSKELKNTATAFNTNQCNSCHEGNAQDDFVFTQHYPVLRAAKGAGEGITPENTSSRPKTMIIGEWEPSAPTPENLDLEIPLEKEALFAYLKSGAYKEFKTQEKEKHPSTGPHTQVGLPVRVFMNDGIANSLASNRDEHPMGASIVKEMFNKNGELSGWAVMVKTQDGSDNGLGWFWYEVTSTEDSGALAAMGNGVNGCISCHQIGNRDMVRTSFPFQD